MGAKNENRKCVFLQQTCALSLDLPLSLIHHYDRMSSIPFT